MVTRTARFVALYLLGLLVFGAVAEAQPTPDPTPPPGQQSALYGLLTNATSPTTPRPVFIGKASRPAMAICLGASCTGLAINPECSIDGTNWGPMTVGSGISIAHGDLTTSACEVFAVDESCRWFRVRNPTVTSCTHSVNLTLDRP